MKTINEVKKVAETLMSKQFTFSTYFGVYTISGKELGYEFKFDTAKERFGCCRYTRKQISLSKPLCIANLDKIDTEITDTILHELAHAFSVHVYGVKEGRGHNYNWKHIAKQIGCNGERCYDSSNINMPKSKYSLVCDSCKKETPKHKMTKKSYACGKCCNEHNNGKFSEKYRMRLILN